MLNFMAAAHARSQPLSISLRIITELRLTFKSKPAQNIPLDHEIEDFDGVLADVIYAARKYHACIGVSLKVHLDVLVYPDTQESRP
jgi:hypothetical protein